MSKHILEVSKNKYESNPNCEICKVLDEQFKTASKSNQNDIARLETLLVNGYHLNDVLESNNLKNRYKLLSQYPSYNSDIEKRALNEIGGESVIYNTYSAMAPTLIFGRWCKHCGSRKHDIYDTKFKADFSFKLSYDKETNILSWNDVHFNFKHHFRILKKDDLTDFELLTETSSLEVQDSDLEDGRVYTYMVQCLGVLDDILCVSTIDVLYTPLNHKPKDIDFEYRIHRYLPSLDEDPIDYLYAKFNVDDSNYGQTIFKLNHDHVPSITYWHEDLYFDENNRFFFPDNRSYFLKPFIKSKKFKTDKKPDHLDYPDKYYWNINAPTQIIKKSPFYYDYIYDLSFTPGRRSMHIEFKLKWPNNIKEFKLYFKQANEPILDIDDSYKVITFKPYAGVEEYVIDIDKLASNSAWVFGVFTSYDLYDEDIRKEYQNISFITPRYPKVLTFKDKEDFYDINLWHKYQDFYSYDTSSYDENRYSFNSDNVWICDHLNHHDVGVLLIHEDEIPECFTLEYDYKLLTKTSKDVLNMFYNFKLQHVVRNLTNEWKHFEKLFLNQDYVLIRWEVMKHTPLRWVCALLDNIKIVAHEVHDDHNDNFSYTEELIVKNEYTYNKKIRHDGKHKYAPERYYYMHVVINPYTISDIKAGET